MALRIPAYAKGPSPKDALLTTCASCLAADGAPLSACGGCQCVAYCNIICQREHWRRQHKAECKPLAALNFTHISGLALAGDASAAFDTGVMLQHGLGTPRNLAEALKHFRASADAGCINANVSLSYLLANGEVARDPVGSARAFRFAAENGVADAANRFGLYCVYGKGVAVNGAAAIRWLTFAVAKEPGAQWVPNAFYELGRIHLFGIGGVRTSEPEAERFFAQGADAGDVDSATALMVLLGTGGPAGRGRKDKVEARKWARRAVALGKDEDKVNDLFHAM